MGAGLTSPVELTRVQRHGSSAFRCGVAEMQGWRSSHEDAHDIRCNDKAGTFWVLDGHGGDAVALEGAPKLGEEFTHNIQDGMPEDARIEEGMISVDASLRQFVRENPTKDSGSTVTGAMAAKQPDGTYTVKLINCGDSRGLLVRGPTEEVSTAQPVTLKVPQHLVDLQSNPVAVAQGDAAHNCEWPLIQETVDHKPSHPTERQRIVAAGGHVTEDDPPRLDGNLAVSRGLGDFEFKVGEDRPAGEHKVSCVPDIYTIENVQPGSILVLCCDGIWDVMSGPTVGMLVRDKLAEDPKADLGDLAASIVRKALSMTSQDNLTSMVIHLTPAEEKEYHPPDEMKGFEKMLDNSLDEDVKSKYLSFLKKSNFPPDPVYCNVTHRWYISMLRCPCHQVVYCSKSCQKKDWHTHKKTCTAKKK